MFGAVISASGYMLSDPETEMIYFQEQHSFAKTAKKKKPLDKRLLHKN
jgi:hypothetical protein